MLRVVNLNPYRHILTALHSLVVFLCDCTDRCSVVSGERHDGLLSCGEAY